MRQFTNKEFRSFKGPLLWPRTLSDFAFEDCSFYSCSIGHRHSKDFSRRTIVRNTTLRNCKVLTKSIIGPGQFDNVQLHNVVGAEVFVLGALYKHVKLSGKFDSLILHGMPNLETLPEDRAAYWRSCDGFYENCDWALDISEAEFLYFEIRARAVPSKLVLRDPKSQVIVRAEEIAGGRWRQLPLGTQVRSQFQNWEFGGQGDLVLVAPRRNKHAYEEIMNDIDILCSEGIARP